MSKGIGKFIAEIEVDYPDHKWLIRALDANDQDQFGTGYLAHIYRTNDDTGEMDASYLASGSTVENALRGAIAAAKGAGEAQNETLLTPAAKSAHKA